MRSALCRRPGEIDLREVSLPSPSPGEVRLRVLTCGICGSDLHWYQGLAAPPDVCPGHEIVGVVDEVGGDVASIAPGHRVAMEGVRSCGACEVCRRGETQRCRRLAIVGLAVPGGFADCVLAPALGVHRVPDEIGDRAASLTEPTAVAVHALDLAGLRAGARVVVLGAGTIGLLCAAVARRAGAGEVLVSARRPHQIEAARALGAVPIGDREEYVVRASPGEADVVVETVGGAGGTLGTALRCVRPGGVVVVAGVFTRPVSIDALALMNDEIRLVGSMAYGRAAGRADFEVALDLLRDEGEDLAGLLVTHRFALEDVNAAFRTASEKRDGAVKVIVEPNR